MLTGNNELEEKTVASRAHLTLRYVIIVVANNSLLTTHYVLSFSDELKIILASNT